MPGFYFFAPLSCFFRCSVSSIRYTATNSAVSAASAFLNTLAFLVPEERHVVSRISPSSLSPYCRLYKWALREGWRSLQYGEPSL